MGKHKQYHVHVERLRTNGFTIVELLIVIAVIGILSAISLVAYNTLLNNANESAASAAAADAAKVVGKYALENGLRYPATLSDADITNSGNKSYQYTVNNATVPRYYCMTVTVSNKSFFLNSSDQTVPAAGGCPGHGQNGLPPVTNLADNPGAETSNGWFSNNSSLYVRTFDTTVSRSGAQSAKSTNVNAGVVLLSVYSAGAISSNGFAVSDVSKTYTGSVYFRSDVDHQARLGVAWRVAGVYSTTGYTANVSGTTGEWTRVTQTFTVPAGADFLRFVVLVEALASQPAGTAAWVDDFMIVEGSSVPEYADGDSTNWLWNGTPGASTSYGPQL